ncbi:hypothetical protein [Arthrobacter zhaoguopingii]|uniref:hypothetical protein n=1 Tax=Arthrobacter zhaoguopingii TaxID=2681491 RepID=UPI001357841D|nr:hypothetical protein [Arthrobacter zhaoguopingii]
MDTPAGGSITVHSAGMTPGESPEPPAMESLSELGIDLPNEHSVVPIGQHRSVGFGLGEEVYARSVTAVLMADSI